MQSEFYFGALNGGNLILLSFLARATLASFFSTTTLVTQINPSSSHRTTTPPRNGLLSSSSKEQNIEVTMYVVKRDGKQQSCQFDKIQSRISKLCYGLDQKVSACVSPP
jgi:hypothetical protein